MSSGRESLPGVRRAIGLLEELALSGEPIGFSGVQHLFADAPPSTVSRLLKVLVDEELIRKRTDGQYELADRASRLGRVLSGNFDAVELIEPVMLGLRQETKQSVAYFEVDGDVSVLRAKAEQPEAFHYMCAYGPAKNTDQHGFGMVCFRYQTASVQKKMLAALKRNTGRTPSVADICATVDSRSSDMVLVNNVDDQAQLTRVVAPVFMGDGGAFVGAVGISYFVVAQGNTEARYISAVRRCAQTATNLLGRRLG